jgi:hypothetical protein
VLIDATIVRGILVPAALALLGDRSWYFPRWLEWLPGWRIEPSGPDPRAGRVRPAAVPSRPEPEVAPSWKQPQVAPSRREPEVLLAGERTGSREGAA